MDKIALTRLSFTLSGNSRSVRPSIVSGVGVRFYDKVYLHDHTLISNVILIGQKIRCARLQDLNAVIF